MSSVPAPASLSAELDAHLARAFGVELDTANWLPAPDAAPEAFIHAAELIGRAIGDRPIRPAIAEALPPALPARPDASPLPEERRAAIARMLAWARAGGASWDGIDFQVDTDGNASVLASRALSAGEPILTLPRKLMIVNTDLARLRALDPRDALASWLALEARSTTSPWNAYLAALPAQCTELPMFRDGLDAIAGTLAHALTADARHDIVDAYGRLPAALGVSLADFAWGCALVKSRGFHAEGTLDWIALLPLIDLLDHRPGDTTWRYDPVDRAFVISTERAFAKGDAVHASYGDLSTTRLFVHYGFTMPSNPADEASLRFELASEPATAVAAHLLWDLPLDQPARIDVACMLDRRFERALSLARLHASGPADRARILAAKLTPYGDVPWIDAAHEEAAFAVMTGAAKRGLAELSAHQAAASGSWGRTCAIVRDAERAVLEQIIEFTTTVVEYLRWRDLARVRTAAAAIPADAVGARQLLREYLSALGAAEQSR